MKCFAGESHTTPLFSCSPVSNLSTSLRNTDRLSSSLLLALILALILFGPEKQRLIKKAMGKTDTAKRSEGRRVFVRGLRGRRRGGIGGGGGGGGGTNEGRTDERQEFN